jgi:hypothetical protein
MIMRNDLRGFSHNLSLQKAALCIKFVDELNMQSLVSTVWSALVSVLTRRKFCKEERLRFVVANWISYLFINDNWRISLENFCEPKN